MGDQFLGEIRITAFAYAPRYWALCNGQVALINQYQALFSLLGNQFGGNGSTTFALPDLRDRVPVHSGYSYKQGWTAGEFAHTLTVPELAQHTHNVVADTAAGVAQPTANSRLAASSGANFYAGSGSGNQPMNASSVSATGGAPHENTASTLAVNFCIALVGIFPSPN